MQWRNATRASMGDAVTGRHGRAADVGARLLPHTSWHSMRIMSWTSHQRQFQVLRPPYVYWLLRALSRQPWLGAGIPSARVCP